MAATLINRSAALRHETVQQFTNHFILGLVLGILVFGVAHIFAAGGEFFISLSSPFAQSRTWILLLFIPLGCLRICDSIQLLCADGPVFLATIRPLQALVFTMSLMFSVWILHLLKQSALLTIAMSHPFLSLCSIIMLRLASVKTLRVVLSLCSAMVVFLLTFYTAFRAIDNYVASRRNSLLLILLWPFVALFFILQALAEIHFDNEKHDFQLLFRSMPFPYTGFPADKPREIRLLRSKPRSIFQRLAWKPRPIEFELFHVDLDEAPCYEAISYLWGSETRDHQIIVNERTINVTANAFKVLQQRGSHWRPRTFWIDTICINQDDKAERGKQVMLMSDIYNNAWRVAAWLGDDADGAKSIALIHFLWFLLCFYDSLSEAIDWLHWSFSDSHDLWVALSNMLRRQWFSRIWVLQEVVVGQHVHIIYGNQYIDWDELADILGSFNQDIALNLLGAGQDLSRIDGKPLPHMVAIDYIRHTMHLRMRYQSGGPLGMGEAVLASTRGATDDRDRIYGLLSMLSDESTESLVPDYEKSTRAVFIEAAQHIVTYNDAAWLLPQAGIGYDRKVENLPSWIPDWSCPPRARTITYFSNLDDEAEKQITPRYWTSGETRLTKTLDDSTHILTLRGFAIDIITSLGPPWRDEDNVAYTLPDVFDKSRRYFSESYALVQREVPVVYTRTGQSAREAFWRTLIADMDNSGTPHRPAPDVFGTYFERAMTLYNANERTSQLMQLIVTKYPHGGIAALARAAVELNIDAQTMQEAQAEVREAETFINAFAPGRRVCVTSKKMLGLAPPKAQDGDLVVILHGVQVPYILRLEHRSIGGSEAASFRLVGEAYMHGIMDGELMSQVGVEEQDFHIS